MPLPVLAVVIVTYSVLSAVEANYTLEIMVHGYRNPTHLSLGQALFRHGCCEGDRDLPCSPCDNAFQFCLRDVTGELHDGCDIGLMESILVAEDDDDLTFSPGDDIGNLTNPMLFTGEAWPGMVELLFTVYDLDGTVTVDEQSSDLVDTILISPMIPAVPSQDDPFTSVMTFYGNYSELDLSFRLTCGDDFYGTDCTVFCVDTNDTSGHYTCDSSTGEKLCLDGYRNADTNCTECVPLQSCSPQGGYCSEPGECLCREGFSGDNCSVAMHPCYLEPCMNEGVCKNATDDPQDYMCECVVGHRGRNCAETDECVPDPCVHGNCTDLPMDYTCACERGYEGKNCDIDTDDCASVTCGGHGQCVDAVGSFTCSCDTGYSGELCEEFEDSSSGSSTLLVIVVAAIGGVLVILITSVLVAIVLLLCRKRKLSKAGEEGVPNPYETPTHFPYHMNGGLNGLEKNFDNPLYTEGSVSPPLPPRPDHPYATLEGAADRYESIPTASMDFKPEQKEESPYLNPVNPMDSSTVVYAHIQ